MVTSERDTILICEKNALSKSPTQMANSLYFPNDMLDVTI